MELTVSALAPHNDGQFLVGLAISVDSAIVGATVIGRARRARKCKRERGARGAAKGSGAPPSRRAQSPSRPQSPLGIVAAA